MQRTSNIDIWYAGSATGMTWQNVGVAKASAGAAQTIDFGCLGEVVDLAPRPSYGLEVGDLLQTVISTVISGGIGALTAWAVVRATRRHERDLTTRTILHERELAEQARRHELSLATTAIFNEINLATTVEAREAVQRLVAVCVDVRGELLRAVPEASSEEDRKAVLSESYWKWTSAVALALSSVARADGEFRELIEDTAQRAAASLYQISLDPHEPVALRRALGTLNDVQHHATEWLSH